MAHMRSHSEIVAQAIDRFENVTAFRAALLNVGIDVSDPTVRSWALRTKQAGIIPPEYWPTFEHLGLASIAELVAGAEQRRFPDAAAHREAAA